MNINNRDNDVLDIFSALLLGTTDGRGDDKRVDGVAGIDGMTLVSQSNDSFTIELSRRGGTDTIVFSGEGVAKIIKDGKWAGSR